MMAAVGLILIVVAIVAVAAASRGPRPGSEPTQPGQLITLDSTTVFNLTQLPNAAPLSGTAAAPFIELRQMIDRCPDFDANHLNQMHQHLTWILDPAQIPSNILAAAVGTDPTGKLLFGMGSFAQNQWLQIGNKPGSCVVQVGKHLNEMLIAAGEPTFKVFQ